MKTLDRGATRSPRRVPYCYIITALSSPLILSSPAIFFSTSDEVLFYEDSLVGQKVHCIGYFNA